jgi:hypothetical protein
MLKNSQSKDITQLLAEADELIRQIRSEAIEDMKEDYRLQFERHTQNLEHIKSKVQGKIDKKEVSEIYSGAEGMHEAILDIVKAMHDFKKGLFN